MSDIKKLDEVFGNAPPIAIRVNLSWQLAKDLYRTLQRFRRQYSSTVIEEQYSLILLLYLLMVTTERGEVTENEK